MAYDDYIEVADSMIVLQVDAELELARAKKSWPLVTLYGWRARAKEFPYGKYPPFGMEVRCYDAAFQVAVEFGLTYVEGFACFRTETLSGKIELFPLSHGWCMDGKGNIIDPTMHKNQHHPSVIYFGVPIQKSYAAEWHDRVGYYGCLDGDREGKKIGVHHERPQYWLDKTAWGASCPQL